MKLPKFLSKYFWDIDFNKLDANNRSDFVLERIMEFGDEKAIQWARSNFSKSQLDKALLEGKNFSAKSSNYWSLILNIPKDKILCLNSPCQKAPKTHWPY